MIDWVARANGVISQQRPNPTDRTDETPLSSVSSVPDAPVDKSSAPVSSASAVGVCGSDRGEQGSSTAADLSCWPHSDAINTAELHALVVRTERFIRQGISGDEAGLLANRLVTRDRDGDDRRLCLECSWLGDGGRCIAAATGRLPDSDRRLEPVRTVLQRCPAFGLRKGLQ